MLKSPDKIQPWFNLKRVLYICMKYIYIHVHVQPCGDPSYNGPSVSLLCRKRRLNDIVSCHISCSMMKIHPCWKPSAPNMQPFTAMVTSLYKYSGMGRKTLYNQSIHIVTGTNIGACLPMYCTWLFVYSCTSCTSNLVFLSELKSYRNQIRPILRTDQRGAYKLKRGVSHTKLPMFQGRSHGIFWIQEWDIRVQLHDYVCS